MILSSCHQCSLLVEQNVYGAFRAVCSVCGHIQIGADYGKGWRRLEPIPMPETDPMLADE